MGSWVHHQQPRSATLPQELPFTSSLTDACLRQGNQKLCINIYILYIYINNPLKVNCHPKRPSFWLSLFPGAKTHCFEKFWHWGMVSNMILSHPGPEAYPDGPHLSKVTRGNGWGGWVVRQLVQEAWVHLDPFGGSTWWTNNNWAELQVLQVNLMGRFDHI